MVLNPKLATSCTSATVICGDVENSFEWCTICMRQKSKQPAVTPAVCVLKHFFIFFFCKWPFKRSEWFHYQWRFRMPFYTVSMLHLFQVILLSSPRFNFFVCSAWEKRLEFGTNGHRLNVHRAIRGYISRCSLESTQLSSADSINRFVNFKFLIQETKSTFPAYHIRR